MVLGKSISAQPRGCGTGPAGLGDDTTGYYESLCMPTPVIASLNSSGGLKFIRMRAYASTQIFNAKIPGAHTSGVSCLLHYIFDSLPILPY